jgi:hypothetical protein
VREIIFNIRKIMESNTHIEPTIAGILNRFTTGQLQAAAAPQTPEQAYRQALKNFDWWFEFSDDLEAWAKGRNNLTRLLIVQKNLDPTGAIWMEYRPNEHAMPMPCVQEVAA